MFKLIKKNSSIYINYYHKILYAYKLCSDVLNTIGHL